MEKQTQTLKTLRQRKLLLVLPLIVLPFLTLLFWALGGGKGNQAIAQSKLQKGLNVELPEAKLNTDSTLNKMSYYDKAAQDSTKLLQQMKSDPYYKLHRDSSAEKKRVNSLSSGVTSSKIVTSAQIENKNDKPIAAEKQVYDKLAKLQTAINKPAVASTPIDNTGSLNQARASKQAAVQQPQSEAASEDPEMKQMNGLLERILDIQHPERLKPKPDSAVSTSATKFKAIPAVVDGKQKITQGTVIRIKLLDTVTINGLLIPKGQLLFGDCSIYNQRVMLNIKSVHIGYSILPADLTVFDMQDGLPGINAPEAITSDAVKDGANNGVQGLDLISMDQSVTTQMTAAGINTAKGLFSKKVKRVKAKLDNGHLLLLRDNNRGKK